jgi:hypothetical protein
MNDQRFDSVSLVLGVAAIGLGLAAWAGRLGELINHPVAVVPALAGLLGLGLIASARRPRADGQPNGIDPPAASTG